MQNVSRTKRSSRFTSGVGIYYALLLVLLIGTYINGSAAVGNDETLNDIALLLFYSAWLVAPVILLIGGAIRTPKESRILLYLYVGILLVPLYGVWQYERHEYPLGNGGVIGLFAFAMTLIGTLMYALGLAIGAFRRRRRNGDVAAHDGK